METDVARNIRAIKETLPQNVRLVAVSKFHPAERIMSAYQEGHRVFGESREQELAQKASTLPKDIQWHFIGHLQTNKVKYIAPYISMIETVDSIKLLREINRQAAVCCRTIKVLLELHIAEETTKYGLTLDECRALLADGEWHGMNNVSICGIMMMASNVDDEEQIRKEFETASCFFDEIKRNFFPDDTLFCERSWGMSDDYKIALQCRSTIVRIGTAIFGRREY